MNLRSLNRETLEPRRTLSGTPTLVVSEIMYSPGITAADEAGGFSRTDFEYLEFANVGQDPVSLDSLHLSGGVHFAFPAVALGPQQKVLVVRNQEAFQLRYGQQPWVLGEYSGNLGNTSDQIRLETGDGQVVFDFEYQDVWYPETDRLGHSLTLANETRIPPVWGSVATWRASSLLDGSPGIFDPATGIATAAAPQVTGQPLSVHHVQLQWTSPAHAVSRFLIYRDGELLGSTDGSGLSETAWRDDSVLPASIHTYQVAAVSAPGNVGLLSQPITITTDPVGGAPFFGAPSVLGQIHDLRLAELSGIAASHEVADVYWTHNDGISQHRVYAILGDGSVLAEFLLIDTAPIDWEDIAVGPGPGGASYVYVGDIGDNDGSRDTITVSRFRESVLDDLTDEFLMLTQDDVETLEFRYPDGGTDAEVLMVDPRSGDLLIVAKDSGPARVFAAAASQLRAGEVIDLIEIGEIPLATPSAGDFAPDGSELLFRNEDEAVVYTRPAGASLAAALQGLAFAAPVVGTPVEPNGEAITYTADGAGYLTISEGELPSLYYFPRLGPAQPGDANFDGVFDSRDLVQVLIPGKFETDQPATWQEGDWNGDGYFSTLDFVHALTYGAYETGAAAAQPQSLAAAAVDALLVASRKNELRTA